MSALRILLAPASGPGVGGGHVMRCAALALALQARGATCTFAAAPEGGAILSRFFPGAFRVEAVARGDLARLAALAEALRAHALVVDDYGLDASGERPLQAPGRVLMAVDDLADRPHAADLVLDVGPHRREADYATRAPGAALLLGPAYALLRPGFAGEPRRDPGPLRRVFVSMGLGDAGGVTARVAQAVRARAPHVCLDVALASDAPSRSVLEAAGDRRIALHPDAADVAALMRGADAAVGAGGSGVWERCAAGLPQLVVVIADNQRPQVEALAAQGAVVACDLRAPDFPARFAEAFARLQDAPTRQALAAQARQLCDGRGAERAAEALVAAVRARA